jgi:hypothetical protein
MSKESKPCDLWNHALGRRNLVGHCPSCGYYFAVYGVHRADCMVPAAVGDRESSRQGHCAAGDHLVAHSSLRWDRYRWVCPECLAVAVAA